MPNAAMARWGVAFLGCADPNDLGKYPSPAREKRVLAPAFIDPRVHAK
jgi:hypothetical protein